MEENDVEDVEDVAAEFRNVLSEIHGVGDFTKLISLDISDRGLRVLPAELTNLVMLKSINASHNVLDHVPRILETLINLEEIILSHNLIEIVDTQLNRQNANVSSEDNIYTDEEIKQVECVSKEELDFSQLPRLTHVNLKKNKLVRFPETLGKCRSILRLDLAYNALRSLPSQFESADVIEHLTLDGNLLTHVYKFPSWLFQIKRCTSLSLRYCYLDMLIESIPRTTGVVCRRILKLDLRNCGIKSFPIGCTGLLDLEQLKISNLGCDELCSTEKWCSLRKNSIFELPVEFANLVGLGLLEARDIRLSKLPDNIGSLVNLTSVDISRNSLDWLPESLADLVNLITLDLSHNSLVTIIIEWHRLTKLKDLNLSFNRICAIPTELLQLKELETLDLYTNCISDLPQATTLHWKNFDIGGNLISREGLMCKHGREFFDRYLDRQVNLRGQDYVRLELRSSLPESTQSNEQEREHSPSEGDQSAYSDSEHDSWWNYDDKIDERESENEEIQNTVEMVSADLDESSENENWTSFKPVIPTLIMPSKVKKCRTRVKHVPEPGQFDNADSDEELEA